MKLPQADLESILSRTQSLWEELRGKRVFITGGTGFFGKWLIESLAHANSASNLKINISALCRDPRKFAARFPSLPNSVRVIEGNVLDLNLPGERFDVVIHAAGNSDRALNERDEGNACKTHIDGTLMTLCTAAKSGATKFLFTSSGAVYGRMPEGTNKVAEDARAPGRHEPDNSGYIFGKREAERWCAAFSDRDYCRQYQQREPLEVKIARCFAFVGPGMPLDGSFAIGNFIRDGLKGGPIIVHGDGTPLRSYMYMSDLAVWLWSILLRGEPWQAYNVGSEEAISIADLAHLVAQQFNPVPQVIIEKPPTPGALPERYIPSTELARKRLNLTIETPLVDAIRKTIAWYRIA